MKARTRRIVGFVSGCLIGVALSEIIDQIRSPGAVLDFYKNAPTITFACMIFGIALGCAIMVLIPNDRDRRNF
jgi:hypothetical protein